MLTEEQKEIYRSANFLLVRLAARLVSHICPNDGLSTINEAADHLANIVALAPPIVGFRADEKEGAAYFRTLIRACEEYSEAAGSQFAGEISPTAYALIDLRFMLGLISELKL